MVTEAQRAWNNNNADRHPIAVQDLAEAAQLLGRPLAEVEDAATRCLPYPDNNGQRFHSLKQLARDLGIIEKAVHPPVQRTLLSRGDAETASLLYETCNMEQLIAAAGVSETAIRAAWVRFDITPPIKRKT